MFNFDRSCPPFDLHADIFPIFAAQHDVNTPVVRVGCYMSFVAMVFEDAGHDLFKQSRMNRMPGFESSCKVITRFVEGNMDICKIHIFQNRS